MGLSQTVLEAAQEYVRRGWAVFPCHAVANGVCTCGRADCANPGKHPRTKNGFKDASKDPAQVARWWTMWPGANVAVATGPVSGVFVVDVDPRHGGYEALDEYEQYRPDGPLPATVRVRTGGGGLHLYFRYPDDGPLAGRTNWLAGVDVKSDGGYVLAPPSSHVSGGTYEAEGGKLTHAPVDLLWSIRTQQGANGSPAGRAALPSTEELLAGVEEGGRDNALLGLARRVLNQTKGDAAIARAAVLEAARNCSPPFPEDEALAKLRQAYRYWEEEQRSHAEGQRWAMSVGLLAEGEKPPSGTTWPGFGEYHDTGLTRRLVWRLDADEEDGPRSLREEGAGWWSWDDERGHWVRDLDERVISNAVEELAKLLELEAETIGEDGRKAALAYRQRVLSTSGGAAIVKKAQHRRELVLPPGSEWDPDPWLLNCSNGVVNLRTGDLLPHSRRYRCTHRVETQYDPSAATPTAWLRMLEWICPDPEERAWLHRALGYSITGSTAAKAFFILTGAGNNGKSTLLETVTNVLGDYADSGSRSLFVRNRQEEHPEAIARLHGVRMIHCAEEVGPNDSLNTERLKTLTGGDKVLARFMHQGTFKFAWTGKLWLASNHIPHVNEWGDALRRRVRILRLEQIPEAELLPMTQVHALLEREYRGILRWLVEGAAEVARLGELTAVAAPSEMADSADDLFSDQDAVRVWLDERWEAAEDGRVTTDELFTDLLWWAASNGLEVDSPAVHCPSKIELGRKLSAMLPKRAGCRAVVDGQKARAWRLQLRTRSADQM